MAHHGNNSMQEPLLNRPKRKPTNTKLLARFNGDLTDLAGHAATGNAATYLTNQKFGQKAVTFAANQYLQYPASNDYHFTGDFTIEMWASFVSKAGDQLMFSSGVGTYVDFYQGSAYNSGRACLLISMQPTNSKVGLIIVDMPSYVANGPHHFAIGRQNGTLMAWMDGSLKGSVANTNPWYGTNAQVIGNYYQAPSYGFAGGIQEFRMSDVCLYTEPFTPPASPFPY